MTQSAVILRYLKNLRDFGGDGWVREGSLCSKETQWGFIGYQGPRRTREMVEKGLLDRRMNGRYAEVRYPDKKEITVEEKLRAYIQ